MKVILEEFGGAAVYALAAGGLLAMFSYVLNII